MAKICWRCQQKEEYLAEKLKSIRQQAKQFAVENGQTVAIWKEGSIYKFGEYTGQAYIELVSQHL